MPEPPDLGVVVNDGDRPWFQPRNAEGTPKPGYGFVRFGQCRRCPAKMAWWLTPAGKLSPHDPDGTSHFATCPEAAKFRRPAHPGSSSGPFR